MDEPDTPEKPTAPATRIGSMDRQQAMDALDAHLEAGRLDADEYGDRSAHISVARTVDDLRPLFADLPAPHPQILGPNATPAANPQWSAPSSYRPPTGSSNPPAPVPPAPLGLPGRGSRRSRDVEPLGGRAGEIVVGVTPFVALGLFFLLHSWLFFLLIPIAGAVVYGRKLRD